MSKPFTALELTRLRAQLPVCETSAIYLNHAGVAPTWRAATEALAAWAHELAREGATPIPAWRERMEAVRELGARLLGCGADEIAFVRNTSHGLALVAEGLAWQPGDRVAVAAGVEYPSNVYPWQHLGTRFGVELVEVPAEPQGTLTVEALAPLLDARVRLVSVSSTQYSSGAVTDLPAIGALCRERGVLLCVDGIQSVGALPLDVKAAGIDFLAADSHKWMLGLLGIGILFVDRARLDELRPSAVGWKSTREAWDFDRCLFEFAPSAARYEEGSPCFGLVDALGVVFTRLLELDVARIAARVESLVGRLADSLAALGCDLAPAPAQRRHVLSFVHPRLAPERLLAALEARGIRVSLRRGRIRVSPHVYTLEQEVDAVAACVRAELEATQGPFPTV